MKVLIFFVVLLLTGCTTTTVNIKELENKTRDNITFKITSKDGPSSELVKHLSTKFCGLDFTASVTKVNLESEWDPLSKVVFSNSASGKEFAVMFYYSRENRNIMPLIMHSDDDSAEPLGMTFSLNEEISVIIYHEKNEFGVSLEPTSKMNNILSNNDKTPQVAY